MQSPPPICTDPCINLFNTLDKENRPMLPYIDIDSYVSDICHTGSIQNIQMLCIIIINTRDINAKGEREMFYILMKSLALRFVSLAQRLLEFVPKYGCWRDMWPLWHTVPELRTTIESIVVEQFRSDQESAMPSLLAKWLPREGSKHDGKLLVNRLAALLFPLTPVNGRLKAYRRACAHLNRIIDTTEIKMCSGAWDTIDPLQVPAALLKKCKAAFYNQRRSSSPGRIQCARNFTNALGPIDTIPSRPQNCVGDYADVRAAVACWLTEAHAGLNIAETVY